MPGKTSLKPVILSFGEALWDCLPRGLFPGGAPLNAAFHLRRFRREICLISAVGNDFLGHELRRRLREAGIVDEFVAQKARLPTGTVQLKLNDRGDAAFNIAGPFAWDRIDVPAKLMQAARAASCLIHGSLSLRSPHNRRQLRRLLKSCQPYRIFDVNLRPPFDNPALIHAFARGAGLVKMNREELYRLLPKGKSTPPLEVAARTLADQWEVKRVCVTLAADGAALLDGSDWIREKGRKVKVLDTVGAGDAFLAALTHYLVLERIDPAEALAKACRLGEFVAGRDGAMPVFDPARF